MYCSASDVAIFIGITEFSTTTNPSLSKVNEIISFISNEIDFFAKNYNIKFDNSFNSILRKKTAIGAAGVILLTYMNNNQSAGSQTNEYLKEYREFLANMKKILLKNNSCSSNVIDETILENWWDYDYYDK